MIQFELRSAKAVGSVTVGETTSTQHLNIRAGVVGLPEETKYKLPEHTVVYEFSNSLSISEASAGIPIFASEWVAENYPTIN
jgi:hypothetical protein